MEWELDPLSGFTTSVLSSGLTVYHKTYQGCPFEVVGVVVHAGARNDPPGKAGTAHFLEHLPSSNVPGKTFLETKRFFEMHGGGVKLGVTGFEHSSYRFTLPASNELLARGFEIFGSMLLQNAYIKSFEEQRKIILQEVQEVYQRHGVYMMEFAKQMRRALFPGHPLASYVTTAGTPEDVAMITRADIMEFCSKYYCPQNMSIVAVGGTTDKDLLALLGHSPFSVTMKGETRTIYPPFVPLNNIDRPFRQVSQAEFLKHQVDQSSYDSMSALPCEIKQRHIHIFKGMLEELFFTKIREEKNFAYGFYSKHVSFSDIQQFSICGKFNPTKQDEVRELVEACIRETANNKDLFEQTKRLVIQSYLIEEMTKMEVRNRIMRQIETRPGVRTLQTQLKICEAMTLKDIAPIVEALHPDKRWTIVVTP